MGCKGWLWPFRTLSLMWLSSQMETFTSRGGVDHWERARTNSTARLQKKRWTHTERKEKETVSSMLKKRKRSPPFLSHTLCWSSAQITLCSSEYVTQHRTGWSCAIFNDFNKTHVVKLFSGAKLNRIPQFSYAVAITWTCQGIWSLYSDLILLSEKTGFSPPPYLDGP